MAKSEKEQMLTKLTIRLFTAMLDDIVLDVTLQSHYEVQKQKSVCDVCHTHCGSAHASSSNATAIDTSRADSSEPLQSQVANGNGSGSGTGTNTPTANGKSDGNVYFECLNCKRQIASNRYAPHLSSCMGVGNGNRRGAARNTVVKKKMTADSARSESPYLGSENGNISDDSKSIKGKGKPKPARKEDAEFALHRKRPGSPHLSPKKSKKAKTSGSPLKNSAGVMLPPTSKKPSQLRESSITSELMQDREGSASVSIDNDSRVSVFSPEATPVTPTSSSGSPSNSATFTNGTNKSGSVKPKPGAAKGKPAKSGTPSRPPPPAAVHKLPDASSYLMGYEGDETGSSTDSESD